MNQYPLVYLDHVTKNYGHEVALMDVSLNIQPGRIIGLLGPNGSGKTTIIKLINGLLQPSLGNIYIHGQLPSPASKKVVSYLPDTTYLNENMKIIDARKITNMKLPNAYVYIKENKLISNGPIKLENNNMKLEANGLTVIQKGNNLQFKKGVFVNFKQNNINVKSDQFEIKREQRQLLWHHNVEVHRGEDILKSDQLIANYSIKPNANYYESLDNIKAFGHVYMKQNGDVALACEMYFDKKTNKSILKKCEDQNQTTLFFSNKSGHK